MEVILASAFSALIIAITVFSMIKVLMIAYKRKELTYRKFITYVTAAAMTGLIVSSVLPFVYGKIYSLIT
ncbi:hypothetical protein AS034_13290 [[Bacillus] enclensis]|uniref:Uncharacterized protein n=1 Tax=[Bacillus] enclensis TaxID=1402860 RepID=A0A0V8HGZ3_9BACI|nr:hypothetical protein [[Bacillus] enclensis]KSU61802.1 hypothetical protein AS034_13290 [[Bacillus] enclensis]QWC23458.1 hypothetical protein KJK41_03545 [Bacillus haikouensis]SCC15498.1 hypothetical protein GA0061094_2750 [[Bacillus] enclensis]